MAHFGTTHHLQRRQLLVVILIALALYVVLPQVGGFSQSLHLLRHLKWSDVAWSTALTLLTYFAAAATYCFLAFKRLPYGRTVLAQFAAMFINRLLPAGLGAVGANYAYLHHSRQTPAQAATMVSLNNLLGLVGHLLLLAGSLLVFRGDLSAVKGPHVSRLDWWVVLVVVPVIFAVMLAPHIHKRLVRLAKDVAKQIGHYREQPFRLPAALTSSILLTLCNVLSLYLCVQALGGHLPFVAVLLVFSFGIGAGAATPTPGGLGGLEAGMVAGFIAYHVPHSTALAAVILYRLISYWLTLVIGAGAFVIGERQQLFSSKY